MDQVIVEIPLPPPETHPNKRVHWAPKSRAKAKQRQDAYFAAIEALGQHSPRWPVAEVEATFYTSRRGDGDNLIAWLKATFDGLEDAGVIDNDGGFIHLPPKQVTGKASKGDRKVVLVITHRS